MSEHKVLWLQEVIERSIMDLLQSQNECPFRVRDGKDPNHARYWCRLGPREDWMPFSVACPYRMESMVYVNPGHYRMCQYNPLNPLPMKREVRFSV